MRDYDDDDDDDDDDVDGGGGGDHWVHIVVYRVPLVPMFGFGENDLYNQVANPPGSRLRRFQTLMTRLLSFSPPLFHGRGVFNYTFSLLPFRRPVGVVGQLLTSSC